MQTIDETRRIRLQMLVGKHGSIAQLNELIGLARTDATLSQVRNQSVHSKTKAPRTMGDPLARKIEEKLGLERGWMDTPPTYAELLGDEDPRAKVLTLMEALPADQWPTAVRLLDALGKPAEPKAAEPKNGTTG
ncbi:MAG: hypothetical protein KIS62_01345 [Ramlibacter sp.]|nr:hypothetical protein [Ramlibacter sp.]